MRLIVAAIVGIACFALLRPAFAYTLRTTGVHTWANAHFELKRMQSSLAEYQKTEGRLPSAESLDLAVEEAWKNGDEYFWDRAEKRQDFQFAMILRAATSHRLRVWDSPPRFTKTSESSDGFGFYLTGEDGSSETAGRDPDDINSWDFSSTSYYYDRLEFRRSLTHSALALCAALPISVFTFALVTGYSRKKLSKKTP